MLSRLFCILFTLSLCCFPLRATPPTDGTTQAQSHLPTCPYCQKQFVQPGNLRRHIADVHHKRRHPCTQCDKVFKHSNNLRCHVRTVHEKHTYDCEQCGQKFTNRRNLKLHTSVKHQGDVYPCQNCAKIFATPRNLKEHHKSVHAGRAYACTLCDKSYVHRHSLKRHCAEVHGITLATRAPQDTTNQASPPVDPASSQHTDPSPSASLDGEINGWVHGNQILTAEAPFDPIMINEEIESCTLEGLEQDSIRFLNSASILEQEMEDWIEILSGTPPQLLLPWEDNNPEPAPKRRRFACNPTSNPGYLP